MNVNHLLMLGMLPFALDASDTNKKPAEKKPNVLFVEVDDLLYTYLGAEGRGFVQTPNIDALARGGVLFSNAVCQGMMCGPSRNSLISGLYPHNLGFYKNGDMWLLPDNVWSVGGAVQRAGYNTAWVGKCHVHPPWKDGKRQTDAQGLHNMMGFDYVVASLGRVMLARAVVANKIPPNDPYFNYLKKKGTFDIFAEDCRKKKKVTSLPEDDYLDGFYANTAVEWLNKRDDSKPFFLWVNFSCPHEPFDVPQKYHDIYKDKIIPPPLSKDFGGVQVPDAFLKWSDKADPKTLPELRRGYAANVTFIDRMVGKLVKDLKKQGLYDNTVIFFFADQGVFAGNHGRINKMALFNEITNPSLIVHYPAGFRKGVKEESVVELLDIIKTTLDITGASDEDKKIPFGESFMPLLTGKGRYKRQYAFAEIEGAQLCFDGKYRYYSSDEGVLLYDVSKDPHELKNIATLHPEVVQDMQKAIDAWFAHSGEPLPSKYLKDNKNRREWQYKKH